MRTTAPILAFVALAVCGCDPCATALVRLQLRSPQQSDIRVTVDSLDIYEAVIIVDSVVTRHGFQRTHDYSNQDEHGVIRRYSLSLESASDLIDCYMALTVTGLEIRFSEWGELRSSPEAKSVAAEVRAALIEKYGESRVS
jgi:hypothetical protein